MSILSFGGTSTPNTLQSTSIQLINKWWTNMVCTNSPNNYRIITPSSWTLPLSARFGSGTSLYSHYWVWNQPPDWGWLLLENQIIHGSGPTAVQSKLGYLLSSPIPPSERTGDLKIFHTATQAIDDCSNISKFWDIESAYTLSSQQSSPANSFLSLYLTSSIRWRPDGSYVVKFP